MKRLLLGIILALVVAAPAGARLNHQVAEYKVSYWKKVDHRAVTARKWVKNHPDRYTFRRWRRLLERNSRLHRRAVERIETLHWQTRPPHYAGWSCIHRYEGDWEDGANPYWGGLQMDLTFIHTYGAAMLKKYGEPRSIKSGANGWTNAWTEYEQMWVAENAYASGRGYYPWPNTANYCRLI